MLRPFSAKPPARAEAVYVAVTPCRIVDTRVTKTPFQNGATRSYYVGGTFGFTSQGGRSGGCGIPIGATAIAANIGSTRSQNGGFLVAWPQNLPRPQSSNVNYIKGQTIAGGSIVPIQKNNALALRVFNSGGPTDVFIDVTGYYAQQIQGMIAPDGSIFSGTDRILSATLIQPGVYRVTVDSDVSNCTPMVDTYNEYVYGSAYGFAGTSVYVYTWSLDPTTHLELAKSFYFYLTIVC